MTMEVKIEGRPSLTINETPLHFMNATTWTPGQAIWNELEINLPRDHHKTDFYKQLSQGMIPEIYLDLCAMDGTPLETWKLKQVWATKLYSNVGSLDARVKIKYSQVEYSNR